MTQGPTFVHHDCISHEEYCLNAEYNATVSLELSTYGVVFWQAQKAIYQSQIRFIVMDGSMGGLKGVVFKHFLLVKFYW